MKDKIFSLEDLEYIGEVLKQKRLRKGLTKYELAKQTGGKISITHIRRIEKGENTSLKTLLPIIKILYNEE